VALVLALAAAAAYGVSDFAGGLASRRTRALTVLLVTQPVGALGLAVLMPVLRGTPDTRSLVLGAVGGLVGGVAVLLLYAGLAVGPMGVVAPLTAVCAGVVPVVAGLALGERPPPLALVGVVAALLAVVLISREPAVPGAAAQPVQLRGVLLALAAGVGFGLFFVVLDRTDPGSGLWPLLSGRVASTAMFVLVALAVAARETGRLRIGLPGPGARWLAVAAGVLDVAANIAYLLAVRQGMLALVAVLVALYPAGTLLLARTVLKERQSPTQQVGLAVAGASVALIALAG